MNIKETFSNLKTKSEVQNILANPNYFLSHACLIQEPNSTSSWEFGFFNKETDKVTVFETTPFKQRQEDEVLKKDDSMLKPLLIDELNVSFEEAMQIADKFLIEKGVMTAAKKIIILQTEEVMQWNITVMTQTFNLINIKINAKTKEILKTESYSIYDLGLKKA